MEFEIYRENDARFHWRLMGDDGTRLAFSAVTFSSAEMARRAADEVRGHVGSAPDSPSADRQLAGRAGGPHA
jgi:uncharacterized protein YegP (UPF0339 family)